MLVMILAGWETESMALPLLDAVLFSAFTLAVLAGLRAVFKRLGGEAMKNATRA